MTAPPLLESIGCPGDLRALPADRLGALAEEIRAELVATVTRSGGHLGPNLGVVELTLAVHREFDSPHDAILWDTGHQSYVHKLLTGRRAGMVGLRTAGGLSGYPSRAESPHDLVENSHASTALSWAAGLAEAFALRGEDRWVVPVVGDGALTGGLCWEALNNLGAAPGRPVVIVLNDNGRSYAPTVGGLATHLAGLRSGQGVPVFSSLGLRYLGPVDGHDTAAVQEALALARSWHTPTVVHCTTVKGKGYAAAEAHLLDCMHAVSPAAAPARLAMAGSSHASPPPAPSWTELVGRELTTRVAADPRLVALTAAMLDPTGLTPVAAAAPDRVRDVGIAEQHLVASAAGLATGGLHPVVCLYSTFLTRAVDQVLMDVALHRLPVTFLLDRAGVTGPDGSSHHGIWDLGLLGLVPGIRVGAPWDEDSLRRLLDDALAEEAGPTAIRFPKGRVGPPLPALGEFGGADVLAVPPQPAQVLLVGTGALAGTAADAARQLTEAGVPTTAVAPAWMLPVVPELVRAAAGHRLVVTLEDATEAGGFGDAFCRAARSASVALRVVTLGLGADFLPHAERADLLRQAGLDVDGVVARVLTELAPAVSTAGGRQLAATQPRRRASAR